jgi:hypothetical protein
MTKIDFDRLIWSLNGLREFHESTKKSTLEDIKKCKSIEDVKNNLVWITETFYDDTAILLEILGTSFELIKEMKLDVRDLKDKDLGEITENNAKSIADKIVNIVQDYEAEKKQKVKERGNFYG